MIKDISARSPYGVKVWYPNGSGAISTVKGIVGDICYFNENPIHHDINEYYKNEKEKGIDKLLLIHDKEEVGFIQMNLKSI